METSFYMLSSNIDRPPIFFYQMKPAGVLRTCANDDERLGEKYFSLAPLGGGKQFSTETISSYPLRHA